MKLRLPTSRDQTPKKKELIFWLSFVLLSLFLFTQINRYNNKINNYLFQQRQLHQSFSQINQQLQESPTNTSSVDLLNQAEIDSLQQLGLTEPSTQIKQAVRLHSPFTQFQSLSPDDIHLLSSNWLLVTDTRSFPQVKYLLKYQIQDQENIIFEVIASSSANTQP